MGIPRLRRVGRALRFRSARLGRRVTAVADRATRPGRAPADRRRSPDSPVLTLTEPGLGPRAMARRGEPWYFAGSRRRYATCTAVTWTRPDRLVTGYLLGGALVVHAFDGDGDRPQVRHLATMVAPERLGWVESFARSADGTWLAVLDSAAGRCRLLTVDPRTGIPDPTPVAECGIPGDRTVHGVTFAPDGSVLFSSIDEPGAFRRVTVERGPGTVGFGPVTEVANPLPDRVPKTVATSPDGRFVAVGYGPNVTRRPPRRLPPTMVDVHRYDPATVIGERVGRTPDSWLPHGSVECVAWTPDGRGLLVTDQAADQALVVDVDAASGAVTGCSTRIGWASGGLTAPHGCAVSPDGKWLAVTNYGDGSLRIYPARA